MSQQIKLLLSNLTTEDVSNYYDLIGKVIKEDFSELSSKYSTIKVLMFRLENIAPETVKKEIEDFLGGKVLNLSDNQPITIRFTAYPPKACLEINLSTFEKFEEWKQRLAIRHECAHMLFYQQSKTLMSLLTKYGEEKIKAFIKFYDEYEVHALMIKKWVDDWLKEPVGATDSMPDPAIIAFQIRKSQGKRESMFFEIQNMVHLITLLKLYEMVPNEKKNIIKDKKSNAKKYLRVFANALTVDSKKFTEPTNWFDKQDLLTLEAYFQKIEKLLTLVDSP